MSLRFDLFPSGAPPEDTDLILIGRDDPSSPTGVSNYLLTWAQLKATVAAGVVWGAITGTLSDQTDLQTALNGKENTGVAAGLVAALAGSLGVVAFSNDYTDLTGIPATFAPSAHAASHENGGGDELALDASQVTSGQFAMARLASGVPDGTKFVRDDGTLAVPSGGGGGGLTLTPITVDLGVARSSGTFDITGLSGLTADKPVVIQQLASPITSKGDARDEFEMDSIVATGYVVDATTIRCYWKATGVVVGDYNFGYAVSG